MVNPSYVLRDSGGLRRLESFGDLTVIRACPSASWAPGLAAGSWKADVSFTLDPGAASKGRWSGPRLAELENEASRLDVADGWSLGLWPGENGQLGAFPEQEPNWRWLRQVVQSADRPLRVLNLFGYTGGSTIACAAASLLARVTHLDGAKAAVSRARLNAERSGLGEEQVRWITDDTTTFCTRLAKRGERFDGIILDPPAFGRGGPKRREWRIERDLPELTDVLSTLLSEDPAFVLLSAHDEQWGADRLAGSVAQMLPYGAGGRGAVERGAMLLSAATPEGVDLPMGSYARWAAGPVEG